MKKLIIPLIGLCLLCTKASAQNAKTDKAATNLRFCQNLLSSERMLLLALQHGDYVKQRMFLSEASLAANNASEQFQRMEDLQKKLTAKEVEDLGMCIEYLEKKSSKQDFGESEPMQITLWAQFADKKLAVIIPKILK